MRRAITPFVAVYTALTTLISNGTYVIKKYFLNSIYCLCSLILAFSFAWFILVAVNFNYGFWHDHTGIKPAIDHFGALNQNKQGFELTTKAQREQAFADILKAVRNGGQGLDTIMFEVPGHPKQTLLVEAEVIHLKDVAHLIDASVWLVVPAVLLWCTLVVFLRFAHKPIMRLPSQALALLGVFACVIFVLLVCGPEQVFNQLHIWAFPDNHQWFFYYQQSLMSTLMHAPELFGWIALEWTLISCGCYMAIQIAVANLLKKYN